eukprot:6198507-Pleurochrysis_carterae.AAC.1
MKRRCELVAEKTLLLEVEVTAAVGRVGVVAGESVGERASADSCCPCDATMLRKMLSNVGCGRVKSCSRARARLMVRGGGEGPGEGLSHFWVGVWVGVWLRVRVQVSD